ncbi:MULTISPECIES: cold shock domain-containing protein CspD [unclassified Pseudomonas]|uniref:cold shock domain-containing protein CspD n=1 Tax=unclassified Pseudomonas TaxID=196821 RepID=UPI000C882839|nr:MULTISPECIES: cold shock domain-containing protein CspD [unclassified Pseudomonas]PMZ89351.1 cold shock domain protein CspD [Pseudomonas sp. FW215-T2]PNA12312.1 cold shock domain protein CspD [Pseudomonas sp. FW215-R3]PNB37394.1 cold shock domain protein CspD [Pseudomonas sp. FW305-131]
MSGGKVSGKVKWFNNAKGYGFIIEDGKTEDLFAHYSAIQMEGYKTLKAGQAVAFDIIQGPKGLHAVNIGNPVDASQAAPSAQQQTATV